MWLNFLLGIGLLLMSHASFVSAEELRAGPVYIDHQGAVSVVVELPFGVTPKASDFRLLLNGDTVVTAREMESFALSGRGLALALCVDVSGTMQGDPLADTREALLTLIGTDATRPQDAIALISFADQDRVESSFKQSREDLARAVRNLRTRGKLTKLYQALYRTLDLLSADGLPKRRRLMVISDGKDEGSTEDAESVIAKAKALNIPIDAVGRGRIEGQYVEALRALANATGGYFVYARPDIVSLRDAIDRIYRDLLETRSFVVYFNYQAEASGQTAKSARIEMQRPGGIRLSANLSQAIPLKVNLRTQPPPEEHHLYEAWLFWLLLVALVGAGMAWLIRRRVRSRAEGTAETRESATAEPEAQLPPVATKDDATEAEPAPPRQTQVGAYRFPVPEPGRPAAVLVALSGPVEGQRFPIEKETFRVGATQDKDLCIMEDEYVSENHAQIRYVAGAFFVFDEGSLNGTFINNTRIAETGLALNLGDHIAIGNSSFEIVAPST